MFNIKYCGQKTDYCDGASGHSTLLYCYMYISQTCGYLHIAQKTVDAAAWGWIDAAVLLQCCSSFYLDGDIHQLNCS